MPIRVEWGNPEKSILIEIIEDEWSLADVYSTLDTAYSWISASDHAVDIIADMTTARFPKFNLLAALGRFKSRRSNMLRLAVIVHANPYIQSLAEAARILAPIAFSKIKFVDTLEQAYALLETNPP